MKPEIRALWVAALRSGEYKQGGGQLRRYIAEGHTRFCCLGVLCNLHAQAHPKIAAQQKNPQSYLGLSFDPSTEVRRWAGLRDGGNPVKIKGDKRALWAHNDGKRTQRKTFKQIAKAIEEQL